MRRRGDFLRAAKGKRVHAKGFTLQAAARRTADDQIAIDPSERPPQAVSQSLSQSASREPSPTPPRFGFTVTKKIGGAVVRNRIRRRLKEAIRKLDPLSARSGHDYVLIARGDALHMAFSELQCEIFRALRKIDGGKSASP